MVDDQAVDTDERISQLAEGQHGLVARRQLQAAGIGGDETAHRVHCGQLEALSVEVLRVRGAPQTEAQVALAGVLDGPPGSVLSHTSAAAWWGLPGFSLARPVEIIAPHQGSYRRARLAVVHLHRSLPEGHLRSLNAIPVTSPALTIFLLAGQVHPLRTERALDTAAAMHLLTYRGLHELRTLLAAQGRNGLSVMASLLAERPPELAPPESGLEKRVQQLAASIGITLRRQVWVGGDGPIGRSDFDIEGLPAALIEVLSQRYHGSLSDRKRDEDRLREYRRTGFSVLTLWDDAVWYRPWEVRRSLLAFYRECALAAGLAPIPPLPGFAARIPN